MKKLLLILSLAALTAPLRSAVLTAVPGPDDQGGMVMPMVTLSGITLGLMFNPPAQAPRLAGLTYWSPGDAFDPSAAWFARLDSTGGAGDLFNNQYGFTFMGSIPGGRSLGLRLVSTSSPQLRFWNYGNAANRFDEVFTSVGSQVLWTGSMWHNYVTLPVGAAPGTYSATFEAFIANGTFTSGTGFVDYSPGALSATVDSAYAPVQINYTWQVVPEPSSIALAVLGAAVLAGRALRRRK